MPHYSIGAREENIYKPDNAPGTGDIEHWRRIENLAMIGSRAGEILHDIKNCLFALSGNIEILKRSTGPDHPLKGSLSSISNASDHMSHLTQMLLDIIRHKEEAVDRVELNTELARLADTLPRFTTHPIEIQLETSKEICALCARRGDIEQIFTNLMINALDAMPQGGVLRIGMSRVTSEATTPPAHVMVYAERYYAVSISDTGEGMTEEVKRHLFEAFYTTKSNGTGLGLAIVSRIVNEYDGWITVDSLPGCGTTFTVFLPAF
jgi:signal transduction histidine kinase